MEATDLAILAAVLMLYAVVSGRLSRTVITPAIAFLSAGIILGSAVLGWFSVEADGDALRLIAETTLTLVLFADASRINLRLLRAEIAVPARLLGIGLPLTILAGSGVALLVLPELAVVEAALLAIAVAPTDAALGQAVISDERVPSRIRQGLNVESGLNDGLCVPLLIIALAIVSAEGKAETDPVRLVIEEIGFGAVAGIASGAVGAYAMRVGRRRRWIASAWAPLVPLAAVGLSYGLASALGGSGLIAAFAAGLTFGTIASDRDEQVAEMLETIGDGFSAATFFVFGAAIVPLVLGVLDAAMVLYGVLALTLARMVPVAIALLGTGVRGPTVAFVGWFGPRGLASIVFGVLILQAGPISNLEPILATIAVTVILSVYAHGLTATPFTERYLAWARRQPEIPITTDRGAAADS